MKPTRSLAIQNCGLDSTVAMIPTAKSTREIPSMGAHSVKGAAASNSFSIRAVASSSSRPEAMDFSFHSKPSHDLDWGFLFNNWVAGMEFWCICEARR